MKNSEIDIYVFGCLDTVAKAHRITDLVWAKESGLKYSPRISELRRMFELSEKGVNHRQVGRSFDIKKCSALINGLKVLIGGLSVKKELIKLIKNNKDRRQRLMLMCLALDEDDEEQVELFLKAIFQVKK